MKFLSTTRDFAPKAVQTTGRQLVARQEETRRRSESAYIRQDGSEDGDGLVREMGCMGEVADAMWEVHTLLKTGLSAHRQTQTDRQTDRSKNSISASFPPFTWRMQ